MIKINTYSEQNVANQEIKEEVINFLFESLDQYGDPKKDIEKCIDYAFGENHKPGGMVITAIDSETQKIVGAVIINKTGMNGYIPENILVYIATDKNMRGKGVGKQLMQTAINLSDGDMALHCEPDNPAKYLYEKLGFTSKYFEMRLKK
ncbi:GNAT family N-acetyltransferase [Kaistella flava (ex Peng et al. 2021)]|uniref:GNAT family N-acetyltransferase n=1 Tax=Kaistella flava (ex Peng et al. 2021) TaxID=2038776 RepID=A0A7M2Y6E9_9FLAO|nr:GNAT family N-acetyltransferase [Kaistella flava (ex Peng et al. 2021)]QOW09215.1 GNAT family N-acetyltransferase [Kaistella flava (ex Peng et al. 2021)]